MYIVVDREREILYYFFIYLQILYKVLYGFIFLKIADAFRRDVFFRAIVILE